VSVAPFVEWLLGVQEAPAEPAGVASERDAGLDRSEAAGAQLGVSGAERVVVEGKAPGDAHQCVAVLGQALSADPPAPDDR
jgi:hypothetical protein